MSTEQPAESPKPIRIAGIKIPVGEQSPLVLALLAVIAKHEQEIQQLRDEIQRLKKTTRRPKINPSRLLKPPPVDSDKPKGKRPGSAKRKKPSASASMSTKSCSQRNYQRDPGSKATVSCSRGTMPSMSKK